MLRDMFKNSKGEKVGKLLDIALLSRLGIIKYDKDSMGCFNISPSFSAATKNLGPHEAKDLLSFTEAVGKVVGVNNAADLIDDMQFHYGATDLVNVCFAGDKEDKLQNLVDSYNKKEGKLQSGVLKTAAKYNDELNKHFGNVVIENKQKNSDPKNVIVNHESKVKVGEKSM